MSGGVLIGMAVAVAVAVAAVVGVVVPGVLVMLLVDAGAAVRVVDINGFDGAFNAG
jgi:hypothetical protein